MNRLVYIRWAYVNDRVGQERVLRKLLSEIKAADFADDDGMFRVMDSLAQVLRDLNRLEESEEIGKEYVAAVQGRGITARNHLPIALTIIARAQYMLGKNDLAEANQRASIEIFLGKSGAGNLTWAISSLGKLESWYREWGRTADAQKVKEEIDGLVELDTLGKEDVC